MREILFRGKRLDNGEWVEGAFLNDRDGAFYICPAASDISYGDGGNRRRIGCWYKVDSSNVGQYTGLTDKNGKRIFEGDIIRTHYANTRNADFVEQVVFHNGRFSSLYKLRGPGNGKMWANLPDSVPHLPLDKTPYMEWCEIIGNIYDNPELLDGGAE